jgi:hypothetical protein
MKMGNYTEFPKKARQNMDRKGAVGGFAPACSRQERASVRPRAVGALANLDPLVLLGQAKRTINKSQA